MFCKDASTQLKYIYLSIYLSRAESERLAAEKLLEEAKSLIEDARVRVDKGEVEVNMLYLLQTH